MYGLEAAILAWSMGLLGWANPPPGSAPAGPPLVGTQPLVMTGDIAAQMVEGVDRFLLRQLDEAPAARLTRWKTDPSSATAYNQSLLANRKRLAHLLGMRDARVAFDDPELITTTSRPSLIGRAPGFAVHRVRWPVVGDVHAEGLLLLPHGKPVANVVAVPDTSLTPEQMVGLAPGLPEAERFAARLAASGCRVLIPTLVDRQTDLHERRPPHRPSRIPHREFLYRSAFELGRHIVGYEVQQILAGVDWFQRTAGDAALPIGVAGWGEGGGLALYAAALDTRINSTLVSGYFDDRRTVWQQPLDRNVFALLEQFGDAELAAMVAPRALTIEAARAPAYELPAGTGAGPARLQTPALDTVRAEFARATRLIADLPDTKHTLAVSGQGHGAIGTMDACHHFLRVLAPSAQLAGALGNIQALGTPTDSTARRLRLFLALDRHNQALLAESAYTRQSFMAKLDTRSPNAYEKTSNNYRQIFAEQVIGRFHDQPLPPRPRTRQFAANDKWTGYEVVLDVFPDVMAYGLLLLPKSIHAGEKRPVVVCQHGLEGRPQDIVSGDHPAYHDFAAKLAERGFIVFAPQNPYIFQDKFRTLQRKANPLGKTLFSVIVPQHQQIVDWLQSLPFVDSDRVAFYGLSYGGKTAMRVPALVTDYCLSICSADFNEWVWKNASSRAPYSYVWTGEYEIFEFDLGSTFNYAEMAALIAPRPFMVERGHFDGVAPDEAVAHEFAKVRHLYQARLGLLDRCAIEWFVGPHTINGKGSFEFLHRHLRWPTPR